MVDSSVITVRNIKKCFNNKEVLKGLSFDVQKGDVLGLLGHNGAGKTTTLRLILGLLKADDGEVSVFDLDPLSTQSNILRRCGVLCEDNGLYESMSVYDNLKFFAEAYGCYDKTFDHRIDRLLSSFNMQEYKHDQIKNFSLGMKKKVAIVRTLFHEPDIVMLDEPTNGLDPVSVQVLAEIIKEYSEQKGITFILTTHNLDIVSKICNNVVIVKDGVNVYASSLSDPQSELERTKVCYRNGTYDDAVNILNMCNIEFGESDQDGEVLIYTTDEEKIATTISALVQGGLGVYEVSRKVFDLTRIYLEKDKEDSLV